jgi:hypothetical protein
MQANGSAAQYYCLNTVNGGGWTLIGSAPAAKWFSGNTAAAWSNLSYSFGTYSAAGTVGDYWTSIANLANASAYDEVMFITGNRIYFLHVLMSSVSITGSGPITFTPIRTSSNMGSPQANNFATIYFRTGNLEGKLYTSTTSTHLRSLIYFLGSAFIYWFLRIHAINPFYLFFFFVHVFMNLLSFFDFVNRFQIHGSMQVMPTQAHSKTTCFGVKIRTPRMIL